MAGNLPDDVRPSDIDRHFGEPETRTVHGTVEVAVTVKTPHFDEMDKCERALLDAASDGQIEQVLHATVEEIE